MNPITLRGNLNLETAKISNLSIEGRISCKRYKWRFTYGAGINNGQNNDLNFAMVTQAEQLLSSTFL